MRILPSVPRKAYLGRLTGNSITLLKAAWREAVFALYLAEEKTTSEVIENMRSWPHSGFSVDQSVYLPAGDRAGIERPIGYIARCPFSLSRLVKVTEAGQVICKTTRDTRHSREKESSSGGMRKASTGNWPTSTGFARIPGALRSGRGSRYRGPDRHGARLQV